MLVLNLTYNLITDVAASQLVRASSRSAGILKCSLSSPVTAGVITAVKDALVRAVTYRKLVALLGAVVPKRAAAPVSRFVSADGDDAIADRVLSFLF